MVCISSLMEAQLRQESLVDRSVMFVQDWNESSFIACHVEIKQRFIAHFHVILGFGKTLTSTSCPFPMVFLSEIKLSELHYDMRWQVNTVELKFITL